jgi:rod shape determining protein RodA
MREASKSRLWDHFDWVLFLAACGLALIGVVNLYSATSVARADLIDVHLQQIYWFVTGGTFAVIVASIDYRHYERYGYVIYGVSLILLLLVFVLGKDIRGSSRWIFIGSFSLQPSEFTKLGLIIALAKYLHDDPKGAEGRTLFDYVGVGLIAAVPMGLVLKQPDLGTALIHGLIFASICAMTRMRLRSFVALVVSAGIFLPLAWMYGMKDYQKERITSFLNPEANLRGSGYHAHHARIAIGNGGFSGAGFMRGTQNQYLFLPDQHSDFPFAVYAEDWGFLGGLVLIAFYAFIVLWAIRIASTAKDRFGAVIAIGVGALVFWHAIFNLGMVTGMLPVVGVTLPLFSAGGSSVMTILVGIGLLMNVSIRRSYESPRLGGLL